MPNYSLVSKSWPKILKNHAKNSEIEKLCSLVENREFLVGETGRGKLQPFLRRAHLNQF